MNGADLVPDQEDAFTTWLTALPGPAPVAGDAASITRGAALFQGSGGCATCHSGAKFTNNETLDVGTGAAFQVPPLVGVSARPPFLHDGCAPTLIDAIGACGHASTHGGTASFTSAQLSDLAAYLGSL
jgi:cytochrome c peroxidase